MLALVKQLYGKGIAAELQVNQAEGSLAQVEAQIPVLEAGLDAAMNALDVLLGVQEAEALAAYRLAVLRATEDVENAFSALVKREAQVAILSQGSPQRRSRRSRPL